MDFTSQIVIAPSWSEAVAVPNPDMVVADVRRRRADPEPLQPDAALHGSAPDEADGEATSGLLLDGRYRLIELLGRGGSGAVYRATDLLLRRQVAVKIFHSSATEPVTAARQRAEMMFLARLNHPNLVSIYDARVVTSSGAGAVNHQEPPTLPIWSWNSWTAQVLRSICPAPRSPRMNAPPSGSRWRRPWRRCTTTAWCTATSSRRTSSYR